MRSITHNRAFSIITYHLFKVNNFFHKIPKVALRPLGHTFVFLPPLRITANPRLQPRCCFATSRSYPCIPMKRSAKKESLERARGFFFTLRFAVILISLKNILWVKLLNCNFSASFLKFLLKVFSFFLANTFFNYLWSSCYKILSFF